MFVLPAPGRKVRDPITKKHLPAGGKEVPESTYWIRRIRCGDVVLPTTNVVTIDQTNDYSVDSDGIDSLENA